MATRTSFTLYLMNERYHRGESIIDTDLPSFGLSYAVYFVSKIPSGALDDINVE